MLYDVYAVYNEGPIFCFVENVSLHDVFSFISYFEQEFGKENVRTRFHFNVKISKEG